MAAEPTVLQVFVFKDGRFFGTECFAQGQIILGRSPDVDLQLDDDITSRSHASIELGAEGLILEDLASSNGTYVNGEPVERCYISSRDEVSIGSFTLKFKILSRNKPKARFRDETRVVDRDQTEVVASGQLREREDAVIRDETEVVDSERLRAVRQGDEPAEPVREVVPSFQDDIASGLAAQLEPSEEFDTSATARLDRPPAAAAQDEGSRQAGDFESTMIEPGQQEPAQPQDQQVPLHDQSTRWLTPDPTEGPALQLEGEAGSQPGPISPAPESQGPATVPEPFTGQEPAAMAPDVVEPSALGPGADVWPTDAEPGGPGLGAPAAPAAGPAPEVSPSIDELADEEDDEAQPDFVEPFSLLNNLIRENFAEPQVATVSDPVMEVIGYTSDKEVLGYEQVRRGKKYRVGADKFVLAHYKEKAAGRILFTDDFSGGVITGGQTVPLDDLKSAANQVGKKKGRPIYGYKLMKGDYANVIHEGGGSFVRFVNPPRLPPPKFQFRLDPMDLKIFGGSFLSMALMIVLLGILGGDKEAAASVDLDRFAKVDLKDVQMEKPEEEVEVPLDQLPEPEKEEEKVEEKEEEKPKEEPKKEKPKKRPKRRSKKKGGGGDNQPAGGGAGMMAALGNLNQKKSSKNIVAAVTNLDAVRVPGGRSRYKVSGLVTKLPSSSVVTSRGKGVGVKGGIDLLRGGKGRGGRAGIGPGALGGGRTGKRGVGGVVFKAPKRKMRVRGTLSREAIAKVVRKHLKQIQYCYERNLLLNPKLSGKLQMEWTISTSGSVSVVKTKQNTMATPAVAMCVSANIKKWKFPKPKGGIVVVTYPFIFNSIGF